MRLIEKLAPYLPYGLKGIDYDKKTYYFVGLDHVGNINWDCNEILNKKGYDVKPILRPLSDLTKEIEVNGEKFIPIDYLSSLYYFEKRNDFELSLYIDGSWVYSLTELPYDVIQKLFEWHFDVFELIEQGLAIDINTLNKKTYQL